MKRSHLLPLLASLALLVACGGTDESRETNRGVTVDLPPFEPEPFTEAQPAANAIVVNEAAELNVMTPAATEREPEAPPAAPKPAQTPPPKAEPKVPPKAETPAAKAPAKAPAPTAKAPETATKDGSDAPRPAAARLPISNERIAQTIQRIGYACGSVTGATPVEGESVPTWRITCSSGDTYRGTSRGGNMRFRKLGD